MLHDNKPLFLQIIAKYSTPSPTVAGFIPLRDSVLVQKAKSEAQTTSGIAIATSEDDEEDNTGTVLAVGPGKFASNGEVIPPGRSVSDKVIFKKFSAAETLIEGEKYEVVSASDCLAKW